MLNNLKIKILLTFVALSSICYSQEQARYIPNTNFFEARYQKGFIYNHATAIKKLNKGNISAIDINYGWQTKGNSTWQQLYRYPKAGVGFYYSMLNYPEILGNGLALYGFINIPLLEYRDKIVFSYHTAFGSTYVTKVYDLEAPVQNEAYSTHFNIYCVTTT